MHIIEAGALGSRNRNSDSNYDTHAYVLRNHVAINEASVLADGAVNIASS